MSLKLVLLFGCTVLVSSAILKVATETEDGKWTADARTEQCDPPAKNSEPKIIKVAGNIHVAVGYALANSIMIEGTDGLIIVDVTESYEVAKEIYSKFKAISNKPIKAIIYTHNHADHMMGGQAFVEKETVKPDIFAHELFMRELERTMVLTSEIHFARSMRQFGARLKKGHLHSGIGPRLLSDGEMAPIVYPTRFVQIEEVLNIAGLTLTIMHIPGETEDQIGVWIESSKTFISADDIYKAFPNLYAIRGTVNRDAAQWVRSLDKIRKLKPKILVPLHTEPVNGEAEIAELLTTYRDAIQFIHDQTVRHMNKGKTADEIVELVQLPEALAKHAYLSQTYGNVQWSIRSVFDGYLGWFDGDPVKLASSPLLQQSQRIVALAGGVEKLKKAGDQAFSDKDFQWSLEIASHLLRLDPSRQDAIDLKILSLEELAAKEMNANARNYYLSCAQELSGEISTKPDEKTKKFFMKSMPVGQMLKVMCGRILPESARGVNSIALFNFTDVNECYKMHVRNSIAELTSLDCGKGDEKYDLRLTIETGIWGEIAAQERSANGAYWSGDLVLDGGVTTALGFFGLFDTEN